MLMGCDTVGSCTLTDSTIEYNLCSNMLAAGAGAGHGIHIKTGSYNNMIRGNSIWNTGTISFPAKKFLCNKLVLVF